LSDDTLRAKYDEQGLAGLESHTSADPGIVFAMLFGEEKFKPYCGDLAQVTEMRLGDMPEVNGTAEEKKAAKAAEKTRLQTQREQQCAKQLAEILDQYSEETAEEWAIEQMKEVDVLSKVNLGPQMLLSIGIMYEITADCELGVQAKFAQLGFGSGGSTWRQVGTVSRAVQSAQVLSEHEKKTKDGGTEDPEDRAKIENAMYNIMAIDIESTVGKAAALALHDKSVDRAQRKQRAQAMLKLGRIFQGKVKPASDEQSVLGQSEPASDPKE